MDRQKSEPGCHEHNQLSEGLLSLIVADRTCDNIDQDLARQIGGLMSNDSATKASSHKTVFHELINSDLPPKEKTLPRLVNEGQTMIAAGQETSSFFLKTTTYYILANAEINSKLKAELKQVIPDPASIPPLSQLEQLPYLHAVVQEGHRFSHGVVGRLQRISPEKPLQYQDWVIPAGTPVSMTALLQHMDASKFSPEPTNFSPERWLNSSEKADKYLVPFSKGTRQCMGINLATAEVSKLMDRRVLKTTCCAVGSHKVRPPVCS